ncbi:MAG TPA: hypothetical protein VET87_05095, partial [Rubrivivax sp.]|nr:hypothetical protein [Rubrivivax sp.]
VPAAIGQKDQQGKRDDNAGDAERHRKPSFAWCLMSFFFARRIGTLPLLATARIVGCSGGAGKLRRSGEDLAGKRAPVHFETWLDGNLDQVTNCALFKDRVRPLCVDLNYV